MLVSHLIERLQRIQDLEGDIPVIIDYHDVDVPADVSHEYSNIHSLIDVGSACGYGVHHVYLLTINHLGDLP